MQSDGIQLVVQAPKTPADSGMDWLAFIASMTDTLIWPIFLGVVIFAFRRQITALADALYEWEGFGGKAKFKRKSEELLEETADAVAANAVPSPTTEMTVTGEDHPSEVAGDDDPGAPSSVSNIMTAYWNNVIAHKPEIKVYRDWLRVEQKLREVAAARNIDSSLSVGRLVRELSDAGIVNAKTASLIFNLKSLDARAKHSRVDHESASNVEITADAVIAALNRALPVPSGE